MATPRRAVRRPRSGGFWDLARTDALPSTRDALTTRRSSISLGSPFSGGFAISDSQAQCHGKCPRGKAEPLHKCLNSDKRTPRPLGLSRAATVYLSTCRHFRAVAAWRDLSTSAASLTLERGEVSQPCEARAKNTPNFVGNGGRVPDRLSG